MTKIIKLIDHNRYLVSAIAIWAVVFFSLIGCQPRTTAYTGLDGVPASQPQTWAEVDAEVSRDAAELDKRQAAINADRKSLSAQVEAASTDLEEQTGFRNAALEITGGFFTEVASGRAGTMDYVATGLALLGLLGFGGTAADNRRKDKVIGKLKGSQDPAPDNSEGS